MILRAPLGVKGVSVVTGAVLHGIGAGDAAGVRLGRVVDCGTAEDVFRLFGTVLVGAGFCSSLSMAAADGKDAACGAEGVGNDPHLLLRLPGGAGGPVT